ncbi:cuticle protein 10.9-like [Argiope bruennichi]|uniref:cuticle protein 10.9-like n=1 Tax=Argiope bruennichi TaxID=94029 RepID=UPI002494D405|nr:cuticle protein 10.9-like [Argiope bruennichi]
MLADISATIILLSAFVYSVQCLGAPSGPSNNIGEYGAQNYPPKPYAFNYQVTDELGNVHFRRESGDVSGTVTGSYGYMHTNGIYRTVEYVAGAGGFKAQVKTNEPGVGLGGPGPADVQLSAEPAPPGAYNPVPVAPAVGPSPAVVRQGYPGTKG